ncbi:cephalosporin-C deacetylase [Kitasatospora xanthocidica]|uniref:acetylxylan esterase n=1 Tax=Kitasatospora xanthocidica TaxID=83382 RepID=UPI001672FE9A|nr:acetylxylan esterase [Kitasatospora xanthocidica]GHF58891.1 cephalosporin-C deacetylase [Kitasatospora xanthocidica]
MRSAEVVEPRADGAGPETSSAERERLAAFWRKALGEAGSLPLDVTCVEQPTPLRSTAVYDVSFAGSRGHRISGWLLVPRGAGQPLACVVQFLGYGEGRGHALDWLLWPSVGHATLVVDTRGQGGSNGRPGATPDPVGLTHPQVPGFVTRGILDPEEYYYRDAYVDAVRAVEAAAAHPAVDPRRIAVAGCSQGGQLALAAAVLSPLVAAALVESPFLSAVTDLTRLPDRQPYRELLRFAGYFPESSARALETLGYFDVAVLAGYGRCPALFSVAGRDDRCAPSTGYAAHARYPARKELRTWPMAEHAVPNTALRLAEADFLAEVLDRARTGVVGVGGVGGVDGDGGDGGAGRADGAAPVAEPAFWQEEVEAQG